VKEDAWATEGRYEDVDIKVALDAFTALRKLSLAFYKRLTPAKRRRYGVHQERAGSRSTTRPGCIRATTSTIWDKLLHFWGNSLYNSEL